MQATTPEEFNKMVQDAGETPIFVDFFATWCGKCQMLAPEIEEIATANKGKALFVKVDIEENDETAQEWDVECLPTIILLT